MRKICHIVVMLLLSCATSEKNISNSQEVKADTKNQSTEIPVWYVHLQRNFVPYGESINSSIEDSYKNYLKTGTSKSENFHISSACYYIDFLSMRQVKCDQQHIYRTARRIAYKPPLTKEEQQLAVPLTFEQIVRVGGHPENYLNDKELKDKKVTNEDSADFFPLKDKVVTDSLRI